MILAKITSCAVLVAIAVACGASDDGADTNLEEDVAGMQSAVGQDSSADLTAQHGIRFVNYWVHENTGAAVDVYVRSGFEHERLLFESVNFGEVRPGTVPEDASLMIYRNGHPGIGEGFGSRSFIASEDLGHDLETGIPLTVVLTYARPLGTDPFAGAVDVLFDAGDFVIGGMPARHVEGALLVALFTPAGRVLGEANPGFKLGVPGGGCLPLAGSTPGGAITVSGGGTAAVTYDIPPGTSGVAAFGLDDTACTGPAILDPVKVNAHPGGRTYIFAFGTGTDDLGLAVLPASPVP